MIAVVVGLEREIRLTGSVTAQGPVPLRIRVKVVPQSGPGSHRALCPQPGGCSAIRSSYVSGKERRDSMNHNCQAENNLGSPQQPPTHSRAHPIVVRLSTGSVRHVTSSLYRNGPSIHRSREAKELSLSGDVGNSITPQRNTVNRP